METEREREREQTDNSCSKEERDKQTQETDRNAVITTSGCFDIDYSLVLGWLLYALSITTPSLRVGE